MWFGVFWGGLGCFHGPDRNNMNDPQMKKVNKQCLSDTPRTVRVSEKTWQVIVRTRRP